MLSDVEVVDLISIGVRAFGAVSYGIYQCCRGTLGRATKYCDGWYHAHSKVGVISVWDGNG